MSTLTAPRRREGRSLSAPTSNPRTSQSWRLTTAVRVFALALATGQVLDAGSLGSDGVVLLGLAIVGAASCGAELHGTRGRTPWVAMAEGVMVSLLIGSASHSVEPLLVYLAIPAVVTGINHGRLATTNTSLASVLTLAAAVVAAQSGSLAWGRISTALPWLVIGLGAGLLAATQTRSLRRLQASQAPYAAAHRLLGQLHSLVRGLPMALDVPTHARALQDCARTATAADTSVVLVRTGQDDLAPVATHGSCGADTEEVARLCVRRGRRVHRPGAVALPLRVGQHVFGAVVLGRETPFASARLDSVQELLDEQAIRLETALLVEDVRSLATAEERNRLARDIHDGVAQRIVSLGYLADEVAAVSTDPRTRQGAEELRTEITRLIGELRFSVFDLRHEVEQAGSLSGALAEYVRELSSHSDLRVHLTLDERGARLPRRTEGELLRIAQEALGNVHKHAGAINVWVGLTVNGNDVRLVVEDDGVGGAIPRAGHYGLHTMRERAERIDADLAVDVRHDGGTVVTLRSRPTVTTTKGATRHDQRLARR